METQLQQSAEAAAVPEKKELTRSEWKEMMRKFFTVRHQIVAQCGHKFDPNTFPRHRNCESCWFAFFQLHGELTQSFDEAFQKEGRQFLVNMQGTKVTEMFVRFMSTIAKMKADLEAAEKGKDDSTNDQAGTDNSGGLPNGDEVSSTGGEIAEVQATSGGGEGA